MRHYIGIDIAKRKHTASVIAEGGERLVSGFDFPNDSEGFGSLAEALSDAGASCRDSVVCMESTGRYGEDLRSFLESHGYEVREVNPILTSNWRKTMSVRKVKNDAVDAEALALWILAGNPTSGARGSADADALRSLTRLRTSLSHSIGDAKRKAGSILDVTFPEYHGFFRDDFGKASMAVLTEWPSAEAVAAAETESIEEKMREAGGARFDRRRAERLKSLAESSVGRASGADEFGLRLLLAQIAFTQGQMSEVDARLGPLVEGSPILTVPGVGLVCGAGILGEIGDISRFASASKLLAFAGCDPSVFESGAFTGSRAHMSKRGSAYLRWYLWLAADRAWRFDPVLGEYYAKKRAEGKCHKVAVSAVLRKLCSIVYAVLRDDKPYVCRAS